ncbi:MAG: hypothetical protein PHH38_03225, partial [Candidatus Cloacimonetes bacterium]|nr:hypothetical protein [Candidatus Cloacimonadota bacterium]
CAATVSFDCLFYFPPRRSIDKLLANTNFGLSFKLSERHISTDNFSHGRLTASTLTVQADNCSDKGNQCGG